MSTETLSSGCETSCQRFATQEFIRPWRTVQKVSFALSRVSTWGYADVMHAVISLPCGFLTLKFHKAFSHWCMVVIFLSIFNITTSLVRKFFEKTHCPFRLKIGDFLQLLIPLIQMAHSSVLSKCPVIFISEDCFCTVLV